MAAASGSRALPVSIVLALVVALLALGAANRLNAGIWPFAQAASSASPGGA